MVGAVKLGKEVPGCFRGAIDVSLRMVMITLSELLVASFGGFVFKHVPVLESSECYLLLSTVYLFKLKVPNYFEPFHQGV